MAIKTHSVINASRNLGIVLSQDLHIVLFGSAVAYQSQDCANDLKFTDSFATFR